MQPNNFIVEQNSLILVTGASGFIGSHVVKCLINYGFKNIRCLARPSSNIAALEDLIIENPNTSIDIVKGNLLSSECCFNIVKNASLIIHLAAGIDKSFPGAFMNSVIATRNLLDAVIQEGCIKRFVNISSFAVYSNFSTARNSLLDETCELDIRPERRFEAYAYGKFKQDQLIDRYYKKYSLPYVNVRPSVVFGPGKQFIPSRVGINTFGIFLHLGGAIEIPLTYVSNCAEAIVLAGLIRGVEGETFNVVDDDLPTSRAFLNLYKKNVNKFFSIYIPYRIFYCLCFFWEIYSNWSKYQLPPAFSRRRCSIYWKGNRYSNKKLKRLLGWHPKVKISDAMQNYFEYQKKDLYS